MGSSSIESLKLEKTRLSGAAHQQKARGTGEFYQIDCDYLFIGIGYVGIPVPELPFDDTSYTIPNDKGRILNGMAIPGLYTSGWIKRVPRCCWYKSR